LHGKEEDEGRDEGREGMTASQPAEEEAAESGVLISTLPETSHSFHTNNLRQQHSRPYYLYILLHLPVFRALRDPGIYSASLTSHRRYVTALYSNNADERKKSPAGGKLDCLGLSL